MTQFTDRHWMVLHAQTAKLTTADCDFMSWFPNVFCNVSTADAQIFRFIKNYFSLRKDTKSCSRWDAPPLSLDLTKCLSRNYIKGKIYTLQKVLRE